MTFRSLLNFYAKTTQMYVFFCVSKFQKMGEFAASIERSKAKSVSALGGFAPWPSDKGSAPGPRWGLRPQTLVIGSRSPCPLCQILNTPLCKGTE